MRMIDADELKAVYIPSEIEGFEKMMVPVEVVLQNIDDMPTVDAVPVAHGEWVDDGDPLTLVCGVCSYRVMRYNNTKFCPDCGAKMDGKDGDGNG